MTFRRKEWNTEREGKGGSFSRHKQPVFSTRLHNHTGGSAFISAAVTRFLRLRAAKDSK
jgi:hypothetical protein